VQSVDGVHDAGVSSFIGEEVAVSDRPELTSASVVISGGRGMQNGDNFSMLEGIADKLNAAIGASRAAVDAGFVPNDYQVGQTGKIVAPDLYIAVGYFWCDSAPRRHEGQKGDCGHQQRRRRAHLPRWQDYGLVADLFAALPELEAGALSLPHNCLFSGGFMAKSNLDDSTADAVVAVVIVSVVVLSVVEWLSGLPA
jgi:electron transfer flavoprotein alpha subunit